MSLPKNVAVLFLELIGANNRWLKDMTDEKKTDFGLLKDFLSTIHRKQDAVSAREGRRKHVRRSWAWLGKYGKDEKKDKRKEVEMPQ
jgi:hypothetical protein